MILKHPEVDELKEEDVREYRIEVVDSKSAK